jgi:hypothetical protein
MKNTLVQKILASGESMREPGDTGQDADSLWPREDIFCGRHDHDSH